jgi:hypothetical protein
VDRGQRATSKGSAAFRGVTAILADIDEVVQQVHARSAQAEADESKRERDYGVGRKYMGSSRWYKDQQILEPLVDSQRLGIIVQRMPSLPDDLGARKSANRHFDQVCRSIHDGGFASTFPDGKIHIIVAGIVEAAVAEDVDQSFGLGASRKVAPRLRSEDAVEETKMFGHRLGMASVRCRGKIDLTSRRFGRADFRQHSVVEGQIVRLNDAGIRQGRLESGLAMADLKQSLYSLGRLAREQVQKIFDHQVGANQSSVQVHDQGHRKLTRAI